MNCAPYRHPLLPVLLALLIAAPATAQDAHYWDNQYGTKGELLGGLVVGSPSDLSATYYNPGWIALGVDASLLVTTQAVEYTSLEVRGAAGTDFSPTQSSFGTSPGFLAGRFNALRAEGWQFAWSYIERVRFSFEARGLRIVEGTVPPAATTWTVGEVFRNTRTEESWYGFTFARRMSERSALGITPYLVSRFQRQRLQASGQAYDPAGDSAALHMVDAFEFRHYRLLAKIGLAVERTPFTFGLTFTTPGLGVYGSGEVYANTSLTDIDLDGDGTPDDYLAADSQEDLKADWNSPPSLAFGAAWRSGNTGLHFTVEYFAPSDQSDVMTPVPYHAQSTGEQLGWTLGLEQKAVFNFGLGYDYRFNDRFSLFGAVRSDFSTIDENVASDLLMGTWDLWHVSAGAAFRFLGIEFTSGLEYSFGNGTAARLMDVTAEDPIDATDRYQTADVRYRRLKAVVGFDLAILTGGN